MTYTKVLTTFMLLSQKKMLLFHNVVMRVETERDADTSVSKNRGTSVRCCFLAGGGDLENLDLGLRLEEVTDGTSK